MRRVWKHDLYRYDHERTLFISHRCDTFGTFVDVWTCLDGDVPSAFLKIQAVRLCLDFCQLCPPALHPNLPGRGDELVLAKQWFGISSQATVAAIVLLIGLPPVIAAYRVIANGRRTLVFICSWLVPLLVLFVLLIGNAILFGQNGDQSLGVTLLGVPLIVLVIDLVAVIVFMRWGFPILISPEERVRL